ncbi:MAG TPA: DUF3426 domain-containing protein [Bryobacteraceae bacterium]|nr:DUF3426 domain-containing protein [Bryobacteraceae bacterium]
MAVNRTARPAESRERISVPPAVIVIAVLVIAGAVAFFFLDRASKQPPPPPPPLTGAARAYVRNLQLTDVKMEAHESYLKQSVMEITGNITNKGDRVLELVEITCVFYDAYGQVILRQRVPVVSGKPGGLAPGETKPFRLPFDNLPESWNQVLPQMIIARIDFA